MKINKTFLITAIFIIILVVSVKAAYRYAEYTAECSQEYRLHFGVGRNAGTITGFQVIPKSKKVNMLKSTFDVDVVIDGSFFDDTTYVSYIHKSERIENIDGKNVAVIEFCPVYEDGTSDTNRKKSADFKEKFTYTLEPYDWGNLIYKFRCGNFEKNIYISSEK